MNRTQKKCFIVSAGFHLLLVVVLFVGPAFLSRRDKPDNLPVLDFVPFKTVDSAMSGGGDRNARPPAATPPAPQPPQPVAAQPPPPAPQPQPAKAHEPDPPKEVKATQREPDSLEPANEHKPRKPEVSTTLVTRRHETDKRAKEAADAKAQEQAREYAEARRRVAAQLGQAASRIGSEISGATTVQLYGPGGGGVPYANFLQAVKSVYARAWVVPDGVTDDDATTAAAVTIARDGTVVSARIIRSSGNRDVDGSVQATLERVTYAAPLPDTAKEDQRTVTINFNVRAKRLLG
jgi:TonB family protein